MLRSHGGRLGACNEPHAIFSHKKPKWDSDNCTGRRWVPVAHVVGTTFCRGGGGNRDPGQ
jgi:hypothetical protein